VKFIFHTAQCGSSLLVTLLGTSNYHTYSEPSWSHALIRENIFPDRYEERDDVIVKLPSGLCCTATVTNSPKVFLYRKLKDHIYRHLLKGDDWPDVNYFCEYESKHCHPETKSLNPETAIEKIVFFWLNDVLWMTESLNVFWLHADDLFLNVEQTMDKVCKFFTIPRVANYRMTKYDVKTAGLKGTDAPLKIINIPSDKLQRRDLKNSVVLRPFRDACPQVGELVSWVEDNLSSGTLKKLSHLIYD
jgi:hypothetical protein